MDVLWITTTSLAHFTKKKRSNGTTQKLAYDFDTDILVSCEEMFVVVVVVVVVVAAAVVAL